MSKKYTRQELIDEIWRFYCEQNKVPRQSDMSNSNGYISFSPFLREFGCWNNAINASNLKINKHYTKSTGLELCSICHDNKEERYFWHHVNEQLVCEKCFHKLKRDYKKGTLDPNSTTGRGLSAENVVAEYLDVKNCNIENNFKNKYDLYHDKYGKINVRSIVLYDNVWHLHIRKNKNEKLHFDTYFFVAFSAHRKKIEHVWIIKTNDNILKNKVSFSITNNVFNNPVRSGLKRLKNYEINAQPLNEIWQKMKINKEKCSFFNKYYETE